jgi:hypothetical protein
MTVAEAKKLMEAAPSSQVWFLACSLIAGLSAAWPLCQASLPAASAGEEGDVFDSME